MLVMNKSVLYNPAPIKDMQTSLRSGYIYMEDAHCTETNENRIYQFLFFELWLIAFTIFGAHTFISKCVTKQ